MAERHSSHCRAPWDTGPLRVSADCHSLEHSNGEPFFWLGDTAWELFRRPDRDEVRRYLENRARKGFNVIQACAIMGYSVGLDRPNAEGNRPLIDHDPTRPDVRTQNDFWDFVDFTFDVAASNGLYIALLPVWGTYISGRPEPDHGKFFNPENMQTYGAWIAERYWGRPNLIWVNGGDCAEGYEEWCALGSTLRHTDPDHLISYHPRGGQSSSTVYHAENWLDINMCQSGHSVNPETDENHRIIDNDYRLLPAKPVLDGEPCYEGLPKNIRLDPALGYWRDTDVRRRAYWSVFAGACGFTYGNNSVHLFYGPDDDFNQGAEIDWPEALDAPGAFQMVHLKDLVLSRPSGGRIPDQAMVAGDSGGGYDHVRALRGDGFAMVYTATGRPFDVQMGRIAGDMVTGQWYDPKTGRSTANDAYRNRGSQTFRPPGPESYGNDWVLILDSQ